MSRIIVALIIVLLTPACGEGPPNITLPDPGVTDALIEGGASLDFRPASSGALIDWDASGEVEVVDGGHTYRLVHEGDASGYTAKIHYYMDGSYGGYIVPVYNHDRTSFTGYQIWFGSDVGYTGHDATDNVLDLGPAEDGGCEDGDPDCCDPDADGGGGGDDGPGDGCDGQLQSTVFGGYMSADGSFFVLGEGGADACEDEEEGVRRVGALTGGAGMIAGLSLFLGIASGGVPAAVVSAGTTLFAIAGFIASAFVLQEDYEDLVDCRDAAASL